MSRNIAKPFYITASIIDIQTISPKYRCFFGEDVELFITVLDEYKKPLDLSDVYVKVFYINSKDEFRQDDGITITDPLDGKLRVMVKKGYIQSGNSTVRVILFDNDQEIYLQPFQIQCLDVGIKDVGHIIVDDDLNARDEFVKVRGDISVIENDLGETRNYLYETRNDVDNVKDSIIDINSSLDNKANKDSIFSMTNMGQDVKEAMTGGSVAVIGNNMANENNLNNNCLNYHKHSKKYPLLLKSASKNLFNKETATLGYYVDRNTGELKANATYFASDFIFVREGNYIKNNSEQCALYDFNKKYLRSGTTGELQTIANDVGYIRICGLLANINSIQFESGTIKTSYEPHIENMLHDISNYFNSQSILKSIKNDIFTPSYTSKNLFNKKSATLGYYVDRNTGNLIVNVNYFASDLIEIESTQQYIKTDNNQFAFYDVDMKFITPAQLSSNILTTPSNAKYVKICGLITSINSYQLKKGSILGDYEPFGGLITLEQCNFKIGSNKTINSIMSKFILSETTKKIKLIGDSITHGEGGTGYDNAGEEIMTVGAKKWYVNVEGHCWANSVKKYFEQKLNCEVTNYGTSGANSATIVQGLSQLIKGDEDLVICTIGTNDRHNNSKLTYCNNLKAIYNYCNERGIEVIFIANIPSSVASETQVPKWHMEDCDMLIMKTCADLGLEYISLYKEFVKYCKYNNISIDSLLKDGLHPNDNGYDVMFYLICDLLGVPTRRDGATWVD